MTNRMVKYAVSALVLCLLPLSAQADDWKECMHGTAAKKWAAACDRVLQRTGISDERRAMAEGRKTMGEMDCPNGENPEVHEKLRSLAEKYPKNPTVAFNHAWSYKACGAYGKAAPLFDQVLLLDETYPMAQRFKGEALVETGALEEALEPHEAAARQDPSDFFAAYELADLYMELKQPQKAVTAYGTALKLDKITQTGLLDQVLVGRARAFAALGDKAKATSDYNQAKRINPNLFYNLDDILQVR